MAAAHTGSTEKEKTFLFEQMDIAGFLLMSAQSASENKKPYDILYYTVLADTGADTRKAKMK